MAWSLTLRTSRNVVLITTIMIILPLNNYFTHNYIFLFSSRHSLIHKESFSPALLTVNSTSCDLHRLRDDTATKSGRIIQGRSVITFSETTTGDILHPTTSSAFVSVSTRILPRNVEFLVSSSEKTVTLNHQMLFLHLILQAMHSFSSSSSSNLGPHTFYTFCPSDRRLSKRIAPANTVREISYKVASRIQS